MIKQTNKQNFINFLNSLIYDLKINKTLLKKRTEILGYSFSKSTMTKLFDETNLEDIRVNTLQILCQALNSFNKNLNLLPFDLIQILYQEETFIDKNNKDYCEELLRAITVSYSSFDFFNADRKAISLFEYLNTMPESVSVATLKAKCLVELARIRAFNFADEKQLLQSISFLKLAGEIWKKLNNKFGLIEVFRILGNTHLVLFIVTKIKDNVVKALEFFEACDKEIESSFNKSDFYSFEKGILLRGKSMAFQAIKEKEACLKNIDTCIDILQYSSHKEKYWVSIFVRGLIEVDFRLIDKAYDDITAVRKNFSSDDILTSTWLHIGEAKLYIQTGDNALLIKKLEEIENINKVIKYELLNKEINEIKGHFDKDILNGEKPIL